VKSKHFSGIQYYCHADSQVLGDIADAALISLRSSFENKERGTGLSPSSAICRSAMRGRYKPVPATSKGVINFNSIQNQEV
jgi:hypothetical protein